MIRRASPGEAEVLAALHVRTWQEAYEDLLPKDYLDTITPSQRLPMWIQLLDSTDRVAIFVADFDDELVGFACGGVSNDEDAEATTGELWSIYLLRNHWNKGIGKELHDILLNELHTRGFEEVTLWVMESNDRTLRWYERQGWSVDGSRKTEELWGQTVTEVRYRRAIE